MTPWVVAIPLAVIILIFVSVMFVAGATLCVGTVIYLIRALITSDWKELLGVVTLGSLMFLFGWVIAEGSVTVGSEIIDGLITRLRS